MKSFLPLLLLMALSGGSGYLRFGVRASDPSFWLDLSFLLSSAGLLTFVLIGFIGLIGRLERRDADRRRRTRLHHQRARRRLERAWSRRARPVVQTGEPPAPRDRPEAGPRRIEGE